MHVDVHFVYSLIDIVAGPLEFVEPDLSSLPPPHSPDPVASEKRDSISDKTKQGTNN